MSRRGRSTAPAPEVADKKAKLAHSKAKHGKNHEHEDDESTEPPQEARASGAGQSSTTKYKVDHKELSKAQPVIVKGILSCLQSSRELESIMIDVVILPAESPVVARMKHFTKQWSVKVKEAGQGHGLGPPHLSAWEGMLESLGEGDIGQANKTVVQEILAEFRSATPQQTSLTIRMCRAKPTYDKTKVKLMMAVRGQLESKRHNLLEALRQLSGEIKSGRAPPTGLERSLQEMLEKWAI